MKKDPIVEEVHQIREKLLDECGGDIEILMDRLKAREFADKDRIISWKRPKERAAANSQMTRRSPRHSTS